MSPGHSKSYYLDKYDQREETKKTPSKIEKRVVKEDTRSRVGPGS